MRLVTRLTRRFGRRLDLRAKTGARALFDGRRPYTASGPSNYVTMLDTATLEVVTRIEVGAGPWGLALAAATRTSGPGSPVFRPALSLARAATI